MVSPARLCPYCGEINEPSVLSQHLVSCDRPSEYDEAMGREATRFALILAVMFVAACIVVPLALLAVLA